MTWDCVVVGGGAAGLSAALVLGRARRRTLLVDAGEPSNAVSPGIGGLLGHDARPPADLYAAGRGELARYADVEVRAGRVARAAPDGDGFVVALDDGRDERTSTVLLATGMRYAVPEVPGALELWGRDVFHCPFCHGWEHRDGALAVLGGTPASVHQAVLLRAWSDDMVLLDGDAERSDEERSALASAGVVVETRAVERLEAQDGRLRAVVLADGERLARDGLLVHAPLVARDDLPEQLGCERTEAGVVRADPFGATSVPGVFAAGDAASPLPQAALAISSGSLAAAGVVQRFTVGAAGLRPPGS